MAPLNDHHFDNPLLQNDPMIVIFFSNREQSISDKLQDHQEIPKILVHLPL